MLNTASLIFTGFKKKIFPFPSSTSKNLLADNIAYSNFSVLNLYIYTYANKPGEKDFSAFLST